MKFYDVCTKREYEKERETKVVWLKCGTLKETDDGKKFIELNMFPATSFYCFEQKPKETKPYAGTDNSDVNWEQQ